MTNRLTIQLEGGCGNQLFQFFAGYYIAKKSGRHLNVETGRVLGNRHAGKCISDSNYLTRLTEVSFIRGKERHKIGSQINKILRKKFEANGVGFPRNFALMDQADLMTGYFQTHYFFEKLVKNGSIDVEAFRSDLTSNLISKIPREIKFSNSTIIHIRGGDYRSQKQAIGMLSTAYYSAVNQRLSTPSSTTYVISDESRETISKRIGKAFQYEYIETSELHPLEIVALISEFGNIGLSNSTLSWWGAFLQKSGRVVAPAEWFFSLESPHLLIPPHWALERSVWEE